MGADEIMEPQPPASVPATVPRCLPLNALRWYLRWPAKVAVLAFALLAVCFPYPHLLARHLDHWRDPNGLIEPNASQLTPLLEELRPKLSPDMPARDTLRAVERFVYRKIPYAWDWDTWGTADYLPTLAEVLEQGREDCDGRAVVAASLLANLGFEAELVTDFGHVWVKTERGETMSPGERKALRVTDEGYEFQKGAFVQATRHLAYGIAVFPLRRELLVLLVLWWLLLRRGGGRFPSLLGLVLLLDGLLILRLASTDYRNPLLAMQMVGLLNMGAGLFALLVWARRNAARVQFGCPAPSRGGEQTMEDSV